MEHTFIPHPQGQGSSRGSFHNPALNAENNAAEPGTPRTESAHFIGGQTEAQGGECLAQGHRSSLAPEWFFFFFLIIVFVNFFIVLKHWVGQKFRSVFSVR